MFSFNPIDAINSYVSAHFFISPFWFWLFMAAVTVASTTAIAGLLTFYFPGTLVAKIARTVSGLIFVSSGVWLWGYRRGERDAENHDKAEMDKLRKKQQQSQPTFAPWKWPWES
jgi:putative Ca2+/H+ antiporter (TMEM165/GDT1 family)